MLELCGIDADEAFEDAQLEGIVQSLLRAAKRQGMSPKAFAALGAIRIAEIESAQYGHTVSPAMFTNALIQPEFQ